MTEHEAETGKGTSTVLMAFLAGAAVGAGLGLLLAPKPGQEVRGKIKDLSGDAVEKSKEYARTMQKKAKTLMEKGKSTVEANKEAMDNSSQTDRPREWTQADESRTPLS